MVVLQHRLDPSQYQSLKEAQKLETEFEDYPNVLMQMFNAVIKSPGHFVARVSISRVLEGNLTFQQDVECKKVDLLSFDFRQAEEKYIANQVDFRFNALNSKLSMALARLQDVNEVLKKKHPSVVLSLRQQMNYHNSRVDQQRARKGPSIMAKSPWYFARGREQ
eukprot:Trichotokara_eunicae@DN6237_c0_g1_i3.p1